MRRAIISIIIIISCITSCFSKTNTAVYNSDSIVRLIMEISNDSSRMSHKKKREIEKVIAKFPNRVINCDTSTYILQTSLTKAYYQYVKRDYKKAFAQVKNIESKFNLNFILQVTNKNYESIFYDYLYLSVAKVKSPKIKHYWNNSKTPKLKIPKTSLKPSTTLDYLGSLLVDCKIRLTNNQYLQILSVFKRKSDFAYEFRLFINRCIDEKRNGLLIQLLDKMNYHTETQNLLLWSMYHYSINHDNMDAANLFRQLYEQKGYIVNNVWLQNLDEQSYVYPSSIGYGKKEINTVKRVFGENSEEYYYVKFNDIDEKDWVKRILSFPKLFTFQEHLKCIDSLLNSNKNDSASYHIVAVTNMLSNQFRYKEVYNHSNKYERFISNTYKYNFYNIWGLAELYLGMYENAVSHLQQSLEYATTQKQRSTILYNIAYAKAEAGHFTDALKLFNTCQEALSHTDYDKFLWLDGMAYLYSFFNSTEALKYFTNAEKYLDESTWNERPRKVQHFTRKARIYEGYPYLQQNCLEKIKSYYNRKDIIFYLTSDTISLGIYYTELGNFYNSIFACEKALNAYKQANSYLSKLSIEDKRRRDLLFGKAQSMIISQQFDKANDILNELKHLQKTLLGNSHPEYIKTLREQISLSCKTELPTDTVAQLYHEYQQAIAQDHYNSDNYDDLRTKALALLYLQRGEEALTALNDADKIKITPLQEISLNIVKEQILKKTKSDKEYKKLCADIIESTKHSVTKVLASLSINDMKPISAPLYTLQGNMIEGITDKNDCDYAMELLLFRKGLLFNTTQNFERILSQNKKTAMQLSHFKSLRDDINTAVSRGDIQNLESLQSELAASEIEMFNTIIQNKKAFKGINNNIQKVLNNLRENDIAVDFVRYENNSHITCYGAFVLSHKIPNPTFVPLCSEKELTDMAFKDNNVNYAFYRIQKETLKGKAMRLIWGKLEPYLKDYGNIYFSADGLIHQLAIEYLLDENDIPINQKYHIHRVFHLADIKNSSTIGDNIVAIGVSDYNSPLTDTSTADRGSWSDLKGVENELKEIEETLMPYKTSINSTFRINDEVRESYVESLDSLPITTLHIAAHGFYRNNKSLWQASENSDDFDHNVAIRALKANKNSLSGLVFRGGNLSWKSPYIKEEKDDIMTNDEIENLSFPKLNLTVLSACETGLGDTDSEGVWGLQRAFRIAGTKSLICSLCKVNDKWASKFMKVFYQNAAQGKTIYDSFQIARNYLYENCEATPKIWASFILIE